MRVLTTAVLVFEWIVLALAVPVAVNVADVPAGTAWAVLGAASVLILAAVALMRTRIGVWLGWAVQAVALAAGLAVPLVGVMGAIFAGLYFAAIRLGTKVDRIKVQREQRGGAEQPHGAGTMAGPDNRQ